MRIQNKANNVERTSFNKNNLFRYTFPIGNVETIYAARKTLPYFSNSKPMPARQNQLMPIENA